MLHEILDEIRGEKKADEIRGERRTNENRIGNRSTDKELLGRLANVKKKRKALDLAVAQLESCHTSRYEANKHIAKETYQPGFI